MVNRKNAQVWPYRCRKLLTKFSLGPQYRPKVGFEAVTLCRRLPFSRLVYPPIYYIWPCRRAFALSA
ncbi:hypothetical protein CROQUDRAFT_430198 [Cronartium quercuum f. sp. fusiforme G11]|uniref:Uncharacterized protein n=1 Tax=Cronartium quercuum f. sp. fusiforme G11 TaxID=708437 RepID=A0A9P6NPW4_9BASI|nr:hypothetical protein CROQUDRAFT_430198 [Cronartium quercuum f. sp. fusiforme G11]